MKFVNIISLKPSGERAASRGVRSSENKRKKQKSADLREPRGDGAHLLEAAERELPPGVGVEA